MTDTNTLKQVERACAQLRQEGHTATFTAVATITGLGRSTLYRDPTIRGIIEQHRHRSAGCLVGQHKRHPRSDREDGARDGDHDQPTGALLGQQDKLASAAKRPGECGEGEDP